MNTKEHVRDAMRLFELISNSGVIAEDEALRQIGLHGTNAEFALDALIDSELITFKETDEDNLLSIKKNWASILLETNCKVFNAVIFRTGIKKPLSIPFSISQDLFFDEKISFSMNKAYAFLKKFRCRLLGLSITLPEHEPSTHAEFILSEDGQNRLRSLISQYFNTQNICIEHEALYVAEGLRCSCGSALAVIITPEGSSAAYVSADGKEMYTNRLLTLSGSEPQTCIASSGSIDDAALVVADAISNLLLLLSPDSLFLYAPYLREQDCADPVRRCLIEKCGFSNDSIPPITIGNTKNLMQRGAIMRIYESKLVMTIEKAQQLRAQK